jgi:hypothetical protein
MPVDRFGWSVSYGELAVDYQVFSGIRRSDAFLPNSSVLKPAGTTDLATLHFAAPSVSFRRPLNNSLSLSFDMAGLRGGYPDSRRNVNDVRPNSIPALIYPEKRYGVFAVAGVSYTITQRLYIGAEAQVAAVWLDRRWYHASSNQEQQSAMKIMTWAGPRIGYEFSRKSTSEAAIQLGRTTTFGLQLKSKF